MKLKLKLKQILSCVALVVAILASCSFNTLCLGISYMSSASAKEYEATNKVDPYEFTSSTQWSVDYNYSNQKDDEDQNVNAFKGSSSSVDIVALEKADKPSIKWDGSTTTPAPESQADDDSDEKPIDNFVMMITADNAETKQYKDVKDDNNKTVYDNRNFVLDSDDNVKFYNDSDLSDKSNAKYLPVTQELVDELVGTYPEFEGKTGKYVEMKPKQEAKDVYYAYKTNSLSLTKQSYYVVSFWVYTTGDAEGSIKISTSDGKKFDARIENIKSDGVWTKYYFFLETRADGSAPTVYIRLYFGNVDSIAGSNKQADNVLPENANHVTGTVYYDNLCFQTINETDYNQKTINGVLPSEVGAVSKSYSQRENSYYNDLIGNPDFENALEDYAALGFDPVSYDWKYFVPEYDLSDATKEMPTLVKNLYKDIYTDGTDIEISKVLESSTFKVYDLDAEGNKQYAAEDTEKENPLMKDGFSTFNANNNVLKISNKNQSYDLGLVSAPFNINQFSYYKISMWFKATDKDSTASIAVFGNISTGDAETKGVNILKLQTVSGLFVEEKESDNDDDNKDNTIDYNNGWTQMSFYVHGNAYRDMDIQLAILANKNSTIYVDHIRVESVLSTEYSSASSNNKLELSPSTQVVSRSITNGYFNSITTESYNISEIKAPYTAQNWTLDADNDEEIVAGIVPTNSKFSAVSAEIGNAVNPNQNTVNKSNVYAVYAPAPTAEELEEEPTETIAKRNYKMTSSSFSLSSLSVYKVQFSVFVSSGASSAFTGDIIAYLTYSKETIAEFKIDASTITKDTWHEYTFLVRTGSSSRSTTMTIGVEDAQGTVFFKSVGLYQLKEVSRTDESTSETIKVSPDELFMENFNNNTTNADRLANKTYVVDYTSYNFTQHSADKVTVTEKNDSDEDVEVVKNYYSSFSHEVVMKDKEDKEEVKKHGVIGVVDTSSDVKLSDELTLTNIANPLAKTDRALLIYNATELATSVTSKTTFSLAKSSFYTIEVYVKTSGFGENNGLTISMDAISTRSNPVRFEKVDTVNVNDNNGYVLYRAIVRTGDSAISGFTVDFILGTDTNKLAGYALVSDVNITKLADKEAYEEIVEAVDENDKNTVVANFYKESSGANSDPTDDNTLVVFFLVFSSILTVVAIVIALVALRIKKNPKKKTVIVDESANNYKTRTPNKKETVDPDKGGFVD